MAKEDSANNDADCKDGFTLFRNASESIVGCYRFYAGPLTWTAAEAFCGSSVLGSLAAARTVSEHNFLISLAGFGTRFWIGANSVGPGNTLGSPTSAIWRWDGFTDLLNWDILRSRFTVRSPPTALKQRVILAGRPGALMWTIEDATTTTAGFICRKKACSPDADVSEITGACSTAAASLTASSSSNDDDDAARAGWITAAVIGGLLLLLVLILLVLYCVRRDKYDSFMDWLRCRKRKGTSAGAVGSTTTRSAGPQVNRGLSMFGDDIASGDDDDDEGYGDGEMAGAMSSSSRAGDGDPRKTAGFSRSRSTGSRWRSSTRQRRQRSVAPISTTNITLNGASTDNSDTVNAVWDEMRDGTDNDSTGPTPIGFAGRRRSSARVTPLPVELPRLKNPPRTLQAVQPPAIPALPPGTITDAADSDVAADSDADDAVY